MTGDDDVSNSASGARAPSLTLGFGWLAQRFVFVPFVPGWPGAAVSKITTQQKGRGSFLHRPSERPARVKFVTGLVITIRVVSRDNPLPGRSATIEQIATGAESEGRHSALREWIMIG